MILVEELPNIYHLETLKKFRDAIRDWIYQDDNGFSLPPLIICLSEIEYDPMISGLVIALKII